MPDKPRGSFGSGAARAAGERRRRSGTPLITGQDRRPSTEAAEPDSSTMAESPAGTVDRADRPRRNRRGVTTVPRSPRTSATEAAKSSRLDPAAGHPSRRSRDRDDSQTPRFRPRIIHADDPPELEQARLAEALGQHELTPGVEDLVTAGIGALRTVASATGLGNDDVDAWVARMLAFIRRRLTGEYLVDDYGFDDDYTDNVFLPAMRLLYRNWFRVDVRGVDNLPTDGPALLVANHSGTIALDALMLQVAVHDEHPAERNLRLLGAELVFKTPIMGALARKQGATLAANADAERLLSAGEVVGVFPEGLKGVGKPFSERYKLQRFGRGGFVGAAVRTGSPIIPCSIVGAEETYPLLADVKVLARLLGAPYFPITPTWPWLGLLGLLPLPSKWIIEFGTPVSTAEFGAAAADDPMLVFDLNDQVRETIQQSLYALLMLRRSVFS